MDKLALRFCISGSWGGWKHYLRGTPEPYTRGASLATRNCRCASEDTRSISTKIEVKSSTLVRLPAKKHLHRIMEEQPVRAYIRRSLHVAFPKRVTAAVHDVHTVLFDDRTSSGVRQCESRRQAVLNGRFLSPAPPPIDFRGR